MKIKECYILKKVMGSYMIVSTDDSLAKGMQTINETGAFLWNLLASGSSKEELCLALTKEYDVDVETAAKDIDNFVLGLKNSGILED